MWNKSTTNNLLEIEQYVLELEHKSRSGAFLFNDSKRIKYDNNNVHVLPRGTIHVNKNSP